MDVSIITSSTVEFHFLVRMEASPHHDLDNDILTHPLFNDNVPVDLVKAHPALLALAHLSSSSEDEDQIMTSGPIRRRTARDRKKKSKSTPYEREMKELTFVYSNWKPMKDDK